jgi:hypothetical protein
VLTLSLETRLLLLRAALLRLGVPLAALARVFVTAPQLLLCTAEELEAQVP